MAILKKLLEHGAEVDSNAPAFRMGKLHNAYGDDGVVVVRGTPTDLALQLKTHGRGEYKVEQDSSMDGTISVLREARRQQGGAQLPRAQVPSDALATWRTLLFNADFADVARKTRQPPHRPQGFKT